MISSSGVRTVRWKVLLIEKDTKESKDAKDSQDISESLRYSPLKGLGVREAILFPFLFSFRSFSEGG